MIGSLYWDNPNCLWILATSNEEGYEGNQTQLGLTKERKIVWEYQSHCSCNEYENSSDPLEEFDFEKKSYELNEIPIDWEKIVCENLKKILA